MLEPSSRTVGVPAMLSLMRDRADEHVRHTDLALLMSDRIGASNFGPTNVRQASWCTPRDDPRITERKTLAKAHAHISRRLLLALASILNSRGREEHVTGNNNNRSDGAGCDSTRTRVPLVAIIYALKCVRPLASF